MLWEERIERENPRPFEKKYIAVRSEIKTVNENSIYPQL